MYQYLIIVGLVSLIGAGFAKAETYSAMDPKVAQEEAQAAKNEADVAAEPQRFVPARYRRERFDLVNTDQVGELQKRLQLTEQILKKHERAYDYRLLSVKELKEILQKLDADKKTVKSKYRGVSRSS